MLKEKGNRAGIRVQEKKAGQKRAEERSKREDSK